MMSLEELEENFQVIDKGAPLSAEELQRLDDEVRDSGQRILPALFILHAVPP